MNKIKQMIILNITCLLANPVSAASAKIGILDFGKLEMNKLTQRLF